MKYDEEKYQINKYLDEINNNSGKFLEDYIIYNNCGICKKNLNKYFCNCYYSHYKNICQNCYGKFETEKYSKNFINLSEMRESCLDKIKEIRKLFNNIIIPLKEPKDILFQKDFAFFKDEEKNEDIVLISAIISFDYNNYFHYKNIERILDYLKKYYSNKYNQYKFKGIGKIFFDNGNYYIGRIEDNLPQGKGILYDKNGSIVYIGNYTKKEGFGKYIFEDGSYYIGQWKENKRKGLGIEYEKNGSKRYEGEYLNDQKEGYGKYVFDDGAYYIGQWKEDAANGYGIETYQNGKTRYEGIYYFSQKGGFGRFFFSDGGRCESLFKNNYPNGKGIEYNKNGKIKFEGDLKYGKREGIGKINYENGLCYIGQFKNDKENGNGDYYMFSSGFN